MTPTSITPDTYLTFRSWEEIVETVPDHSPKAHLGKYRRTKSSQILEATFELIRLTNATTDRRAIVGYAYSTDKGSGFSSGPWSRLSTTPYTGFGKLWRLSRLFPRSASGSVSSKIVHVIVAERLGFGSDHRGGEAAECSGRPSSKQWMCLFLHIMRQWWLLRMEFGYASYMSHFVGVFVDGVACDRSMDKHVCGQSGRLQFESPPFWETNAALGSIHRSCFGYRMQKGD